MPADATQELFLVFTHYTIHGNASDPSLLCKRQFARFCEDCGLFDSPRIFNMGLCDVVYSTVTTRAGRGVAAKKMTFVDFVGALGEIATRVRAVTAPSECRLRNSRARACCCCSRCCSRLTVDP